MRSTRLAKRGNFSSIAGNSEHGSCERPQTPTHLNRALPASAKQLVTRAVAVSRLTAGELP
jgi:hypothetical protein